MDDSGADGEPAATSRRGDTDNPRLARARAVRILFQADLRDVPAAEVLDRILAAGTMLDAEDDLDTPLDGFTQTLVRGVDAHRDDLDALIQRFARRWSIHRMPVVDRTLLRLAVYELLHETTSPAVVINEAVELAKDLSTDDSGRYVNGVLESIRKTLSSRQSDRPSA